MNNELNYVRLAGGIEFTRMNDDCYILTNKGNGEQFCINRNSYEVLSLLNGQHTVEEALEQTRSGGGEGTSLSDVAAFFVERFSTLGVLAGVSGEEVQRKPSKFRKHGAFFVELAEIKLEKYLSGIAGKVRLGEKKLILFYALLYPLLMALTVKLLFFTEYGRAYYSHSSYWGSVEYLVLFFALVLAHEIGHIVSAVLFGKAPRSIGFGVYLVFPAFFVNMSNIWDLKRIPRIIINLSGVVYECVFILGLLLYMLYVRELHQIIVLKSMFLLAIINFIPFYKSDGYWVLADYFNEPNFHLKSIRTFKRFWADLFRRRKITFSVSYVFHLAYASFSLLMIYYVVSFVVTHLEYLIDFPRIFFMVMSVDYVQDHGWNFLMQYNKVLMPLIVYIFVIKMLLRRAQSLFAKAAARKAS